jgi:hypothetical protein
VAGEYRTLNDSCQLMVLVKIDELSLRIARRVAMAGITLAAESNVSQIKSY